MYAAAGGASLASRQKQRQQKTRQKAQRHVESLPQYQPHAKQFHNYTEDPPAAASISSVIPPPILSRVERGALRPPTTSTAHERRHSASHRLGTHSTSRARLRASPSISIPVQPEASTRAAAASHHQAQHHHPPHHREAAAAEQATPVEPQLPRVSLDLGPAPLERRCSFVRQVEEMSKGGPPATLLDRCHHICNFEIEADRRWEDGDSYYYYDEEAFGSMDYPFSEGRAAWEERERRALRRGSMASDEARQLRTKQTEAHHRWMRRNRVRDASAYGAGAVPGCVDPADLDPFDAYRQSAAANALLYVGLGATALGAVIFFVGTGEKGFQTVELRMIGPTLVACGLLCCLARVLLCACPVPACCARRARAKEAAAAAAAARPRWPLGDRAAAGALLAPIAAVATTAQREREEEVVTEEKPHQSPPVPPIAGIPLIHLPGDSPAAASAAPSPAPSHSSAAEAAGPPEETRACGDGDADIDSCDRQHSGVVLSPLQLEH